MAKFPRLSSETQGQPHCCGRASRRPRPAGIAGVIVKVVDEWTMSRMDESRRLELAGLDASWDSRYRNLARERNDLARQLDESRATLRTERVAANGKYQRAIDAFAERQKRFAVVAGYGNRVGE